mgnify:CR=1
EKTRVSYRRFLAELNLNLFSFWKQNRKFIPFKRITIFVREIGKAGEVGPKRFAYLASSPTHLIEITRRRILDVFAGAPW